MAAVTLHRSCHYENAVEHYLRSAGVPYVATADVRPWQARFGIKAFDYLVRPSGTRPCLVDVKGRKTVRVGDRAPRRWNSWVTRYDVEGLSAWKDAFGPQFDAAFVFAFWMDDEPDCRDPVPASIRRLNSRIDNRTPARFRFAGRCYEAWVIRLTDYAANLSPRSVRWDTVHLASADFRQLAWPISAWASPTSATCRAERQSEG